MSSFWKYKKMTLHLFSCEKQVKQFLSKIITATVVFILTNPFETIGLETFFFFNLCFLRLIRVSWSFYSIIHLFLLLWIITLTQRSSSSHIYPSISHSQQHWREGTNNNKKMYPKPCCQWPAVKNYHHKNKQLEFNKPGWSDETICFCMCVLCFSKALGTLEYVALWTL